MLIDHLARAATEWSFPIRSLRTLMDMTIIYRPCFMVIEGIFYLEAGGRLCVSIIGCCFSNYLVFLLGFQTVIVDSWYSNVVYHLN